MKRPELLAPAGSLKSMQYAFDYGADAVYAGQPRYSLRVRNNEFHGEKLFEGIRYAHDLGQEVFPDSKHTTSKQQDQNVYRRSCSRL